MNSFVPNSVEGSAKGSFQGKQISFSLKFYLLVKYAKAQKLILQQGRLSGDAFKNQHRFCPIGLGSFSRLCL